MDCEVIMSYVSKHKGLNKTGIFGKVNCFYEGDIRR